MVNLMQHNRKVRVPSAARRAVLGGLAVFVAAILIVTSLPGTALAQAARRIEGDQARTVEQIAVTGSGTGLLLSAWRLPTPGEPVLAIIHRKGDLAAVVLAGSDLNFTAKGVADVPLLDGLVDDVTVRDVTAKDVDGDRTLEAVVTVEGRKRFFGKGDSETHAIYVIGIGKDGAPTLQLAQELRFRGTMQQKCESHIHARAMEMTAEDLLGDDHADLRVTVKESLRDCEAPSKPCSGEELACKTVNTQAQELWIWKDGAYHRSEGD